MATIRWKLLPTPDPSALTFAVLIPQDIVSQYPTCVPQTGALFKTLGIAGNPSGKSVGWIPDAALAQDSRFGLYVYTGMSRENLDMVFFYGRPKTPEEANKPFREYTEFKNHHWPKILQGFAILQDYTFPNVTNVISGNDSGIVTAPQNYAKWALVDSTDEGTRFVTEEFWSPTKFDIPGYPTPATTSIHVEVLGRDYDFPDCLHPKIVVPNTVTGSAQLVNGVGSAGGGALNGQVIPATNFETWAPYVLTDQQEYRDGGWYRIRVRVFPPPLPETAVIQTR